MTSKPRLSPPAARRARWMTGLLALAASASLLAGCPETRRFIFPVPEPREVVVPAGAEMLEVPLADGSTAYAVLSAAPLGAPTIVYCHGNGQQLSGQMGLLRSFAARGVGFCAVGYPGYGPAARFGPPSEDALYAATEGILRYLDEQRGVRPEKVVLVGFSLGTGVAAEMAARGLGGRLVLLAPYTSIPDMAEEKASAAARSLILDAFDTLSKASRIAIPTLIVHGERDRVIPVSMGQRIARALPQASLWILPNVDHGLWRQQNLDLVPHVAAFAQGQTLE